jgi:hypothetical protein
MKSDVRDRPVGATVAGTPLDYMEDLYRFYFETVDADGAAERVLRNFLGPLHAKRLRRLAHGYEFVAPIQCAPDLISLLSQKNIAVYQLVRQGKPECRVFPPDTRRMRPAAEGTREMATTLIEAADVLRS